MATDKPPSRPGHHVTTNKPPGRTGHHVATNKPPGRPGHHVATNKPSGKPDHHVAPNKPPGKLAITWHLINLWVNLAITWRPIKSFPCSHVLSQQYRFRVIPQNFKIPFFKTIVFQGGFQPLSMYPKYSNATDSSTNSVQLPNS